MPTPCAQPKAGSCGQPGALSKEMLLEVLIAIPLQIFALVSSGWALLGSCWALKPLPRAGTQTSEPDGD